VQQATRDHYHRVHTAGGHDVLLGRTKSATFWTASREWLHHHHCTDLGLRSPGWDWTAAEWRDTYSETATTTARLWSSIQDDLGWTCSSHHRWWFAVTNLSRPLL